MSVAGALVAVLIAAVGIGLLLGLLGGGGSILTFPVLVYLAGQQAQQAIPASLFVVAVTSLAALVPHAVSGRVQWRVGFGFGTAGLLGAYGGGRLAAHLPPALLLGGFAFLMAVAAILMIRSCRRPVREVRRRRLPATLSLGLVVGLVTGLVGAGGGFVIVPILVLFAGLPMATAVGTSLFVIALQASAGFAGHLQHATIDWPLTLTITALAVAGSLAGARLTGHLSPRLLRTGFGWFVAAVSALVVTMQAPDQIRYLLANTATGRIIAVVGVTLFALAAMRNVRACRNAATPSS